MLPYQKVRDGVRLIRLPSSKDSKGAQSVAIIGSRLVGRNVDSRRVLRSLGRAGSWAGTAERLDTPCKVENSFSPTTPSLEQAKIKVLEEYPRCFMPRAFQFENNAHISFRTSSGSVPSVWHPQAI